MADSLLTMDDNHTSEQERQAIIAKWKDKPQDELLSAKAESDLYIKTLTARIDDLKKDYLELRERHQAGTELKDLIDQLKSKPQGEENPPITNQGSNQPAIKPEELDTLVSQRVLEHIKANDLVKNQQENFRSVQAKLKEHFGSDYQNVYKQRLDTLGMSSEFADDLAKNHPQVFMKTFELDAPRQNNTTVLPRSQQRQVSFAPNTPVRNWAYYQEMKKSNPKMYLDPKIAVQMHDDAIALGDAFGMPED